MEKIAKYMKLVADDKIREAAKKLVEIANDYVSPTYKREKNMIQVLNELGIKRNYSDWKTQIVIGHHNKIDKIYDALIANTKK